MKARLPVAVVNIYRQEERVTQRVENALFTLWQSPESCKRASIYDPLVPIIPREGFPVTSLGRFQLEIPVLRIAACPI